MFHFPHTHSEICPYLDALEKGRGGVKTILIKLEQNIKDLKPSNCGEVATTCLGNRRTEFRDKFQKFPVLEVQGSECTHVLNPQIETGLQNFPCSVVYRCKIEMQRIALLS